MKTKFLSLLLITAIYLAGTVFAATFTASLDGSLTKADNSVNLTVTNPTASTITVNINSIPSITDKKGNSLAITSNPTVLTINASQSAIAQISYSGDISKFALGTFSKDITLVNAANATDNLTKTLSFVSEFCKLGVQGSDLDLSVDINNKGLGQEDTEWYPLDEIELKVDVENNGNDRIDNIKLKVCLYNPDKEKCIMDEKDMELSDNNFRINDGDNKVITITFKLDPEAVDDNVDDYVLHVKSYSDDLEENASCNENSEDITVIRDKHFIVLTGLELPETAECNSDIELTGDVWNIGEDDETDTYAIVSNKELGINQRVDIGDIDVLSKESVTFPIHIPEKTTEKKYPLKIAIYDDNDDIFENDNNDQASYTFMLDVKGNCVKEVLKSASILPVLETADEDVKAGNDVAITATIKNTGEELTSYTIGIEGNEAFSSVKSISPLTVSLNAGESKDVLITLKLNDDANGEQTFNIKAIFDSKEVKQPVSLLIGSGSSITGSAIGVSIKKNWFIWVIVLINVILIIAIILVAVRMSRA